MDNFTHSLAGWALSRAGLAKKTGLATATLVIAANIPDIDAVATMVDGHEYLAIRRGITHGPIALLVLPLILTWAMIAFDNWQTRRGKRPEGRLPINRGWLLALAYIGAFSHPALDFMNSYGVRFLEPLSSQWSYGDTLFVIDVWIWSVLALGIWLSRKREKLGQGNLRSPVITALAIVIAYVGLNAAVSKYAVMNLGKAMASYEPAELIVANPVPVEFWKRDMIWQREKELGFEQFNALAAFGNASTVSFSNQGIARNMDSPLIEQAAQKNPDLRAFLFWSRMPYAEITEQDGLQRVTVRDARFHGPVVGDRFSVTTELTN